MSEQLRKYRVSYNYLSRSPEQSQSPKSPLESVLIPGGGGGGTLIFSYIRRLGPFFLGQIFDFQYFLGFSEK